MSGQHRSGPPEDCAPCRALFAVLASHHQEEDAEPLSAEAAGGRCGLGRRAAYVHLAHLARHRRITADRRPAPGATVRRGGPLPADATPLQWAANAETRDRTCAACLRTLARKGWSGQMSTEALAAAAGVSERTAERHRAHLRADGLVEFERQARTMRSGRHVGRSPDRYRLMSGQAAMPPRMVLPGDDWHTDVAAEVLATVRWFSRPEPETREARRQIAARLRNGWPAAVLEQRLLRPLPPQGVGVPLEFLRRRLPHRDEAYVPTAQEAVTGVPGGRLSRPSMTIDTPRPPECLVCREPLVGNRPHRCAPQDGPLLLASVDMEPPPQCHQCQQEVRPAQWLCHHCGADQRQPA